MTGAPFLTAARAQTMLRDVDRLRNAIRAHDSEATEAAWEKCERWVSLIQPNNTATLARIEELSNCVAVLEAKLAKAVMALRLARDAINGLVDSGDAFDDINATLAELTGEKNA